jgi:hypothetical protein
MVPAAADGSRTLDRQRLDPLRQRFDLVRMQRPNVTGREDTDPGRNPLDTVGRERQANCILGARVRDHAELLRHRDDAMDPPPCPLGLEFVQAPVLQAHATRQDQGPAQMPPDVGGG